MTPDLATLIERLEHVNAPDANLDGAIFHALNPELIATNDPHRFVTDEKYVKASEKWSIVGITKRAPDYTASIDAALTLVPEDVALWQINMAYNGHPYEALIIPLPPGNDVYGASKTSPAIAICIASLRARLELSKGGVRS